MNDNNLFNGDKNKKQSVNKNDSKPYISFGHDNWNLVLHMIFGVD